VNVSATLLQDSVRESKLASLARTIALLREPGRNLGEFLTTDPKGKLVPAFLAKVCDHLQSEQQEMLKELSTLTKNVEHIKEVVAMQQNYARVSGLVESLPPAQLVEDAIRINAEGLEQHRIEVERDFADVPLVSVDKHKVLQILINLIGNAKHAVSENRRPEKRIRLILRKAGSGRVAIAVHDNGIGIAPGNLTRVFQHGFTTKRDGHGFGLHSSANAAKEMGGRLVARSDGLGHGATFELELPTADDQRNSICKTTPETKTDVSW
jgi:C4-dicarboxylate-specific signal transduction histidine kinase